MLSKLSPLLIRCGSEGVLKIFEQKDDQLKGGLRYVVSHKSDFGNQEIRQLEL